MTESEYFAEFIKQYRADLPRSSELSSFVDFVEESANDLVSDYLRGKSRNWLDQLQEPNMFGVQVTRQDALEAITAIVTGKDRIVDLAQLFIRELEYYDNAMGQSVPHTRIASTRSPEKSSMLMGYAIGQAFGLNYSPEEAAIEEIIQNARSLLTKENINFIIGIITFIALFLPNSQLGELIELQKLQNALIQQNNEQTEAYQEQKIACLENLVEEYEKNTNAINAQTEAIKANTQAIEQLTEKMDAEQKVFEEKQSEATDSTSCCNCDCHEE